MIQAMNATSSSRAALNTLTATNLAAQSAEQISLAAVPMVAVLALNAGPGEIGALDTAQTLPFLLLSIPAGVLADRWSRSRADGARPRRCARCRCSGCGCWCWARRCRCRCSRCWASSAPPARWASAWPRRRWCRPWCAKDDLARANARLELARSVAFAGRARDRRCAGGVGRRAAPRSCWRPRCRCSRCVVAAAARRAGAPRGAKRHLLDELRHGAVWSGAIRCCSR